VGDAFGRTGQSSAVWYNVIKRAQSGAARCYLPRRSSCVNGRRSGWTAAELTQRSAMDSDDGGGDDWHADDDELWDPFAVANRSRGKGGAS
jgi:hypothetical protein